MRTLLGIRFLMSEIAIFERMSTAMVATPIPMPLMAVEVTPSVGHIPKMSANVGFSLRIPLVIS
jgi:hypothetical protein